MTAQALVSTEDGNEVRQLEIELTPRIEQAIRLYACGKFKTQMEAAGFAGCHASYFGRQLNSASGKYVVRQVKEELTFRMGSLYQKFVDTLDEAFDDPKIEVRLAAANLYAKTEVGTKTKVELSAEDTVRAIMDGTYQQEEAN